MEQVDKIRPGDKITVSGVGLNKSGDIIQRIRNDNKPLPFWGTNLRTGKRGQAIRLAEFKAQEHTKSTIPLTLINFNKDT